MARINRKRILHNVSEAREQLEEIERVLQGGAPFSEVELGVMLEHAYHHLNWAWNTRSVLKSTYDSMTDRDFNLWSKVPKDLEPMKIDLRRHRDDG
jgi:ubiquinone/menaquinone biosynthesis C-methylase UbiE